MNTQRLLAAGVDYNMGVKRFMGRERLYIKVLGKFPNDDTFKRLRDDMARGDTASLLRDAHEFKGMCGNIALTRLFERADTLVGLLRSGIEGEALAKAFSYMEEDYTLTKEAIVAAMEETP